MKNLSIADSLIFALRAQSRAPEAFVGLHRHHGPAVRLNVPGRAIVSVAGPADVAHVLRDREEAFGKGDQGRDLAALWGDDNVLLSSGEAWRNQRRACAPLFRPASLVRYDEIALRHAHVMLDKMGDACIKGVKVHLYPEFRRCIMRTLMEAWFGLDEAGEADEMGELLRIVTDIASKRVLALLVAPLWAPTPGHLRMRRAVSRLHRLAGRLLARSSAGRAGLFGDWIQGRSSAEAVRLSPAQAVNNFFVFALAAYEFPSLGWALSYLAQAPDDQSRIRREAVLSKVGPGQRLEAYPRALMVLNEAMRLMPPSPMLARFAESDVELPSGPVAKGTMVVVPVQAIHHSPQLWPEPDMFLPARFSDPAAIAPMAFLPFGSGARACVGAGLAMRVKTLLLVKFFERFAYSASDQRRPHRHDKLKPFPHDGVPVQLRVAPFAMEIAG